MSLGLLKNFYICKLQVEFSDQQFKKYSGGMRLIKLNLPLNKYKIIRVFFINLVGFGALSTANQVYVGQTAYSVFRFLN